LFDKGFNEVMKKHSAKEHVGKIKLYADENIRYGIVLVLRSQGINIKHAAEVRLTRKDDECHFQYAKKSNRWLFTTDRGFLNNRRFPFEQIKGIVIVPDTGQNNVAGKVMAWIKHELVPSGKGINHCKIELNGNAATFHFRREGKIYIQEIYFS